MSKRNPYAMPGDEPDTIYFRRTDYGGVALVCAEGVEFDKKDIVSAARMMLEVAGFGPVGFVHCTAVGYFDIKNDQTADDVQRLNAEADRKRAEEDAFDMAWIDAHDLWDKPEDRKREAAAERKRKQRERDKQRKRHAESATSAENVTPECDIPPECHAESATIAPHVTQEAAQAHAR